MSARAHYRANCTGWLNRDVAGFGLDQQNRFFANRRWETGCGSDLQTGEAPDRWVFAVSLIILPFMLML